MEARRLTKMALLTALLCISAYISFPLPFSPAMVTALTLVATLTGLLLQPKDAFIVFIIYVGMGVEGCAYATVIAQAISAVLCLIYIVKKFPILHLKKENFTVSFQEMGKLLALGIPMALQFSITAIGVKIGRAHV